MTARNHTAETVIHGYDVLVERDDESTQCWISSKQHHASASLACLQATGELQSYARPGEDDHEVRADVIDKITEWAEKNGY